MTGAGHTQSDPHHHLGHGNLEGSAFGERGISKRLESLSDLGPLEGDRLLDIGCASGAYTMRLAERFAHVEAIDVEPKRLRIFADRLVGSPLSGRVGLSLASAEAMPYRTGLFDVVTAIEVLEHIPDLNAALAEVHRVLKPGGWFFVTGPNRYFPLESHGPLIRGRRYRPSHVPFLPWVRPLHRRWSDARSFTVRSLGSMFREHGFELEGRAYLMPPFDRSPIGRRVRTLTDALERTPLRVFGLTLVVVSRKPGLIPTRSSRAASM
jgi:ubiquinone/menaquinone biosynthesis C-methylase UbiE